jgi:hypothetical protein
VSAAGIWKEETVGRKRHYQGTGTENLFSLRPAETLTVYWLKRGIQNSRLQRNPFSDLTPMCQRRPQLWRVTQAPYYKPEGRGFEIQYFFSIYLILPGALDPEVHSASNINDYQKQKIIFLEQSAAGA